MARTLLAIMLRRKFMGGMIAAILASGFASVSAMEPINRDLSYLTPGIQTSIRLKSDQVISEVTLSSIDQTSLAYRSDTATVRIERDKIYRVLQQSVFYSDLKMTAEDHTRFTEYVEYLYEHGDVVVEMDKQTYVGKITAESETAQTIKTRSATYEIQKSKIAAWRRAGIWHGDPASQKLPVGSGSLLSNFQERERLFHASVFIEGPWAVTPQIGLGLSSNVNWPIFGGIKAATGYIHVDYGTLGFNIQASAFLNANLINLGSVRIYAGTSYRWRATLIGNSYNDSTLVYGSGRSVNAQLTQNSYTVHIGAKYKNLLFEAGAELPIEYRQNFVRPRSYLATDQAVIEQGVSRLQSSIDTLNKISQVYVAVYFLF
jgi:hypothetical protein